MTGPLTTTEQAAVDAMIRAGLDLYAELGNNPGLHRIAVAMLREIPGNVLTRLAIERIPPDTEVTVL